MKKLLLLIPVLFLAIGCNATVDVASMSPEARFNYAHQFLVDEDFEVAVKELESFLLQYPGSEFSDDAQFDLGTARYKKKEYLLAAYEFSKLIKNMPASSFLSESQYMLASSYEKLSPPSPLDQKYTKKAIEEFQAFVDFFPADPKSVEAEKTIKTLYVKLADKDFNSAVIYERMEYFSAAISCYGKVAETFHDTKYAPMALHKKISLLMQKKRFDEATLDIDLFLNRYSESDLTPQIKDFQKQIENSSAVSQQ